jgi:rhodanese-related sulfurtransferase
MFRSLLLTGLLAGCSLHPPHVDTREGGFRRIDVETFRAEREAGAFQAVVDVRSPAEFAAGHVPQALNIPIDQLKARTDELAAYQTAPIAVICESGGRSLAASSTLVRAGFTGVVDVEGGTRAWRMLGHPLIGGP